MGGWLGRSSGADQGFGDQQQQSQTEGESERQVASRSRLVFYYSSCLGPDGEFVDPNFPKPVVTVDLMAPAQILALSVRECAPLTDSPDVWAG